MYVSVTDDAIKSEKLSAKHCSQSESSTIDQTTTLFSKIIEKELTELPKHKRIECMQELLEVLKKFS